MMGVYLIHFDRPFWHARHYVGFVNFDIVGRLAYHANGRGSRLMKAVTEAGIGWRVVRFFKGYTRDDERRIKNSHHTSRYCPICRGNKSRLRSPRWVGFEGRTRRKHDASRHQTAAVAA